MNLESSFRTRSYTELLARLDAAGAWLQIEKGRTVQYSQLIKEFYENGSRSSRHFLAIGESSEIVRLFELWEDRMTDLAKERLRNAIELDKDVRKLALDDEDLRPLWDWVARLQ